MNTHEKQSSFFLKGIMKMADVDIDPLMSVIMIRWMHSVMKQAKQFLSPQEE